MNQARQCIISNTTTKFTKQACPLLRLPTKYPRIAAATMPSGQVDRVTMFKIPDPKAQEEILSKYKTLQADALKVHVGHTKVSEPPLISEQDGKPYIVSAKAGYTENDPRNQGFNIVANTTFASMADFEFYDKDCEAHKVIREFAKSVHQGVMMVYFKSVL